MATARKGVTAIAVPLRAELANAESLDPNARRRGSPRNIADSRRTLSDARTRRPPKPTRRTPRRRPPPRPVAMPRRLGSRGISGPVDGVDERSRLRRSHEAEERWPRKLAETIAAFNSNIKAIDDAHLAKARAHADAVATHWDGLFGRWSGDSARVMAEVGSLHAESDRLFPSGRRGGPAWTRPRSSPPCSGSARSRSSRDTAARDGEGRAAPGRRPGRLHDARPARLSQAGLAPDPTPARAGETRRCRSSRRRCSGC